MSASATAVLLFTAQAAVAAPTPLVDHTVGQSIGGAQICLVEECLPEIEGVRNVRLRVTYEGVSAGVPGVESADAPNCAANVNVAFRLVSDGIGPGGIADLLLEFDRTDKNGRVVPGSHGSLERTVLLPQGAPVEKDPVFSLCGTVIEAPDAPAGPRG